MVEASASLSGSSAIALATEERAEDIAAAGISDADPQQENDDTALEDEERREESHEHMMSQQLGGADHPPLLSESAALSGSLSACAAAAASSAVPHLTMRTTILVLKEEQRALQAVNKAKSRGNRNAERRSKRLEARVGGVTFRGHGFLLIAGD